VGGISVGCELILWSHAIHLASETRPLPEPAFPFTRERRERLRLGGR